MSGAESVDKGSRRFGSLYYLSNVEDFVFGGYGQKV